MVVLDWMGEKMLKYPELDIAFVVVRQIEKKRAPGKARIGKLAVLQLMRVLATTKNQ